jgi:proteasome accessory factor B
MDRPIRLMEMLQLLGGRRSWRPAELAERFGMSERNIYRDLQALSRLYGIPVTNDERGYRLLEGATLRSLPLTATERAMLTLLLAHPALGAASDMTAGLSRKLDVATRQLEETPQALTLAGPERSGELAKGLLSLLEQAVRERTPVSLLYRSLWSQRQAWRGLNPYAAFHRENTWYLVGHCHLRDEPRTFRLDRIVEVKRLEGGFDRPSFDLDAFLQTTWGIYRGRTLHEVVIHFDASLESLIQQGAHHSEERVSRLDNGALEYRVTISHLDEIARWIVGFAGAARAVEPPALVARVSEIAGGAHERHREAQETATGAPRPQRGLPGIGPRTDDTPTRQRDLI